MEENKDFKFTIDDALKIQNEQLAEWKTKLRPDTYKDLNSFATATNDTVTDPYQVVRGSDLTNFIANWKPEPKVELLYKDVQIEKGDKVRTADGDYVISGFYYHLQALFVRTECNRVFKGVNINGIITKE